VTSQCIADLVVVSIGPLPDDVVGFEQPAVGCERVDLTPPAFRPRCDTFVAFPDRLAVRHPISSSPTSHIVTPRSCTGQPRMQSSKSINAISPLLMSTLS
jgi:hypothetical protein